MLELFAATPTLIDVKVDQTLRSVFPLIVPELILLATACVLFLLSTVKSNRVVAATISVLGLLTALNVHLFLIDQSKHAEALIPTVAPILGDSLAHFVRGVSLVAGLLLVLMGWNDTSDRRAADHYACLLCAITGLSLVASANDLIFLFLALELISIPTYVLLYLPRYEDQVSQEAAIKYFLMSILSSAMLLFGFSYLYGLTGTTNLKALVEILPRMVAGDQVNMALIAIVLCLAGLGFKITAFPFHFYAPDVYQGGPTGVVAMLAFVPKMAGFVALTKLFGSFAEMMEASPVFIQRLMLLLWIFSAVTMTMGNVLALLQTNLKRMLAYSSVAHTGYMLMGLAVLPTQAYRAEGSTAVIQGNEAIYFYLICYGIMTIGAFASIAYLNSRERPVETIEDLSGLHETQPWSAATLTLFLFSMIGLPLTAGFVAKFLLFLGAMSTPAAAPLKGMYPILALVAAVNAAIAAFYYLRIVGVMYLRSSFNPVKPTPAGSIQFCITICALLTLVFGIFPSALFQQAKVAVGP
jgi:NADH-quinone oxidoreductase subunit N